MHKPSGLIVLALFFYTSHSFAAVNYEEFLQVKQALYQTFKVIHGQENEVLTINKVNEGLDETYWWDIDMVHASYVHVQEGDQTFHNIYLMGGFARIEEMTPDGLLITGCHEMAHGIGGAPRKNPSVYSDFRSSTEGQSDYFATKVCLPVALGFLNPMREVHQKPIYEELCSSGPHQIEFCLRMMMALESDVAYFNDHLGADVSFEKYSTHIQYQLNLEPTYYPDGQCRLDTMINGILGLERSECWFPGGEANGTWR